MERLSINVVAAVASPIALAAAVWSLVLGVAGLQFRKSSEAGVAAAIRLAPGDASYLARDPKKATSLNPYFSWGWIQLGLAAESRGDATEAERCLLRAAAVDRLLTPRWVLCDFYYRQGKIDLFWSWARKALEMDESDSRPIFRLAHRAAPNVREMVQQLAPSNVRIKNNLFSYLVDEGDLEAATPTVAVLIPSLSKDKASLATHFVDKLIDAGLIEPAVNIWDALCARRFLPFAPLNVAAGRSLTNGDFANPPAAHGFDWHLASIDGVTPWTGAEPGELKLRFSGEEPDEFRILFEKIPVVPGVWYDFRFRNWLDGATPSSGLKWRVYKSSFEGALLAESQDGDALGFRSPGARLILLSLEYKRPRGSMPLSGVLTISHLALQPSEKRQP